MLPGAGGRRVGSGCFQWGSQNWMQNSTNDDTSPANNSRARAIRPGTSLIPGPWTSQTSCPGPRPKGCRRRPVSKGKELAFFFPPRGGSRKEESDRCKGLKRKKVTAPGSWRKREAHIAGADREGGRGTCVGQGTGDEGMRRGGPQARKC